MPRLIEYIGEQVEISDYLECHRPENQGNVIDGIPINPVQRPEFDMTPNEDREAQEIEDWWGRPYIRTVDWDGQESYEEYAERISQYPDMEARSKEEFVAKEEKNRENWFKHWPTGVRYEVRCLDGGAWDRSTSKAMVPSLEEALGIAKTIQG